MLGGDTPASRDESTSDVDGETVGRGRGEVLFRERAGRRRRSGMSTSSARVTGQAFLGLAFRLPPRLLTVHCRLHSPLIQTPCPLCRLRYTQDEASHAIWPGEWHEDLACVERAVHPWPRQQISPITQLRPPTRRVRIPLEPNVVNVTPARTTPNGHAYQTGLCAVVGGIERQHGREEATARV